MKFSSAFLITGILLIGVVGISMMSSHEDCLFGRIISCDGNNWAMINAHASAFQEIFSVVIASFVALISLFCVCSAAIPPAGSRPSSAERRIISFLEPYTLFKESFHSWLALHEQSPALLLARV